MSKLCPEVLILTLIAVAVDAWSGISLPTLTRISLPPVSATRFSTINERRQTVKASMGKSDISEYIFDRRQMAFLTLSTVLSSFPRPSYATSLKKEIADEISSIPVSVLAAIAGGSDKV